MRTLGRMDTTIERVFQPLNDGTYREITLYLVNFYDQMGTLQSQKINKEVFGPLWKKAREGDRSFYGEVMHKFPQDTEPTRLVCLGLPDKL